MSIVGSTKVNACKSFLFTEGSLKVENKEHWLATLLEGVNNKFFKVNFKKYILFKNGCFKAVKLVKKVILVINGVSTTYLWTKNEEKRPILSVFSNVCFNTEIL